MDIYRGRIELRKNTFQTRTKKTVVLARLDIGGSIHRNPDGEEIPCPHLHLYREGSGSKWAIPIPADFSNIENAWTTLDEFMDYCKVITKPTIIEGLFP